MYYILERQILNFLVGSDCRMLLLKIMNQEKPVERKAILICTF